MAIELGKTKIEESKCPQCGHKINAAIGAANARQARAGDVGVCGYCGCTLTFMADGHVRAADAEDLKKLEQENPGMFAQVVAASTAVQTTHRAAAAAGRGIVDMNDVKCTACGTAMRLALSVEKASKVEPKAGDFTMCLRCGELMRFVSPTQVRKATPEDLIMLGKKMPELLQQMAAVRAGIARAKAHGEDGDVGAESEGKSGGCGMPMPDL